MRPAPRRSQSRNRRVSNVRQRRQQHLLDVKVRSRRVAQHRARRALAVLSRVVLVAALCAAIYAGTREAARRLFFENPDYQLKTIEFQTDGTLQREQILKMTDLQEGENIFRVNLGGVHEASTERRKGVGQFAFTGARHHRHSSHTNDASLPVGASRR